MKKGFYFIGIALLFATLFARYIYIQLSIEGSGRTLTMSPEESKKEVWFIRTLDPEPKEVNLDSSYNVIIKKAWLEHDVKIENKIFWFTKLPSKDRLVLKIIFVFKNRTTGEIREENGNTASVNLINLDGSYPSNIIYKNSASKVVVGNPNQDFKLRVSDGVSTGTIVTFK